MLSMKRLTDSLKAFFPAEKIGDLSSPKVTFSNNLDYYLIRIDVSYQQKDQLKVSIDPCCIIIKVNQYYKKILFSELVDVNNVKKEYGENFCLIEIPKAELSPEEKLNQLALMMGF